jgi:hypothetical protein
MKDKIKVIILYLLIFSFFFISEVIAKAGEPGAASQKEGSGKVVAFYFHGNYRCSNCKKIEQYSREAIEKYFKEQNKHFVEDYQLYTRSLVIAEFKDGKQVKWKNLTKVWDYLNDRDNFYNYVQSEIQKYLENI